MDLLLGSSDHRMVSLARVLSSTQSIVLVQSLSFMMYIPQGEGAFVQHVVEPGVA